MAAPGRASTPVGTVKSNPQMAMMPSWIRPTRPMPTTLPSRSWPGLTVESRISTTRLAFSETTPCPMTPP